MKKLQDSECRLNKNQCDELETLRLNLWNNTHNIEKHASNIVQNIDSITNMILGTKQDPFHMSQLMEVRRTATFLESTARGRFERIEKHQPESLYDQKGKEYKKIGFFNNIIGKISADCGCPYSTGEKTPKDRLTTFTLFPTKKMAKK